jgi:lysophospholipase L1-like esterase
MTQRFVGRRPLKGDKIRTVVEPMRTRHRTHGSELGLFWGSALVLLFTACSGESPEPQGSSGGSAGTASDAAGARAGTSGSAGSAASPGGQGGVSGSSGSAGTSGAGAGGTAVAGAGSSVGGTGGTGGEAPGGSAGTASGGSGGTGPEGGPITIWIAGDSTVATKSQTPCPIGWGGQFGAHFNEQVTVVNSAIAGRSVRTWLYDVQGTMDTASGECVRTLDAGGQPTLQQRWKDMLANMKSGDYLFIQFGINDGDPNCPRHVGLETFKAEYGMMAQAAKERGAHPVFVTPVSSIACNGSTPRGTRGEFVPATIQAGESFDVPVIDLHALSVELYGKLQFCPVPGGAVTAATTGPVGDFFCDDHTHFAEPGAVEIAKLVAQALFDQGIGLAAYLK